MKSLLAKVTLSEATELIRELMEKLCGDNGRSFFDAVKKIMRKDNSLISQLCVIMKVVTIKVNKKLKTIDDFQEALKNAKCIIDGSANYILENSPLDGDITEDEMELVIASAKNFGIDEQHCHRSHIYHRAIEFGSELCSAKIGLQAIVALASQLKNGEELLIGIEPLFDSRGNLRIFCISRRIDGELHLIGCSGDPKLIWGLNKRWIFAHRKISQLLSPSK